MVIFHFPDTNAFIRPNEDIQVTSLCIVEKAAPDSGESQVAKSRTKKDQRSKVKKRQIQPSLICGVSLRHPKTQSNCDDSVRSEIQTDVQLMNKVNESVSGETSPQIITDSDCDTLAHQTLPTDEDILNSATNFIPYLLVVAVKEDLKRISKQPSTDSLKPSTSSGNMVPTLGSMSMNQPDWSMLDMYDSDQDVQIVKVTPGPTSLSTSSPTESSKQDDMAESSGSGKVSIPDSAITRLSCQKSGNVLQCVEFPSALQSEHLEVKSVCTTLDKQHLVVVVAPKSTCSSQLSLTSVKSSQCAESGSDSSDASIAVISSTSTAQTDSSKKSSGFSEMSETSSSDVNTNTNSSTSSLNTVSNCGCILIYKFTYDLESMYAFIEEKPVLMRHVEPSEAGISCMLVLPGEVCEQVDEEIVQCEEEIFVSTPSVDSVQAGKQSGLFGQLAVIFSSGKMSILNICDLSVLASIQPPAGDKFIDVTFCSGNSFIYVSLKFMFSLLLLR